MNINDIHEVSARMLTIERINMAYNKATNFGNNPNGQEAEIEKLLAEWDKLKQVRRILKEGGACLVQVANDENGRPEFPDYTTRRY